MAVITGAIIGGAMSLAGGIFGGRAARRQARAAKSRMRKLNSKLNSLEANRQDIINPYADVTSTADMLSNPFTQLSVSTAAMDMQIEQTDQALANTLDTLRQTGGGAGSATALAQAALQSKKDVAADIERQEVQNDKARIQGEANLQRDLIAEEQRMQSVDVQGKQFVYSETEQREQQQLDRVSNQIAAQQQNLATSQANQSAATSGMFSALGGIATSAFGS
jgi:septal ring factor EnvC (AmiA/AmiB activator)